MEKTSSAPKPTRSSLSGGGESSSHSGSQRQAFLSTALNMSWQLAIAVLLPIVGGARLDAANDSSPLWVLIGLAVAILLSGAVLWNAVQAANRMPVPKLTEEQRQKIRKSYDEEDDD